MSVLKKGKVFIMSSRRRGLISALFSAFLFTLLFSDAGAAMRAQATPPSFKKVMIVIFENKDFSTVDSQPFFSMLAKGGATLTQFVGEAHPSQGNYFALTSGSLDGVRDDNTVNVNVFNIVDSLERNGKSWRAYVQGFPGNCYTGGSLGKYARKHNPFISYVDIQTNPARCSKIVEASELTQDIAHGMIPDYSFYVPDLNNDGHDTSAAYANQWFSNTFGPLIQDPHFMQDMLLIATFDESESQSGNHTFTALYGNSVIPGSTVNTVTDHITLLRTIEDALGLGTLGPGDSSVAPLTGIWR